MSKSKTPVPEDLVHTCGDCQRTYVSRTTGRRYDATGHVRGSRGLCERCQARLLRRIGRPPVPAHLVYECTACGREYVNTRAARLYDPQGRLQGSAGLCARDRERIKAHGAPVTVTMRATDVAAEVEHLLSMGMTRDAAVRQLAQDLGRRVDSIQTALRRAAVYAAREQVAA